MGSQLCKMHQFQTVKAVKVQADPYNEEFYTSTKAPAQTEYDKQNSEYESAHQHINSQVQPAEFHTSESANYVCHNESRN